MSRVVSVRWFVAVFTCAQWCKNAPVKLLSSFYIILKFEYFTFVLVKHNKAYSLV